MGTDNTRTVQRVGEVGIATEHHWECITPGCHHRRPPRYATSIDCYRAALHHVRWTGHKVRIEATTTTRSVYVPGDADDWTATP
jgi:hypothetical protein